jgi:hypothetical protein
VPKIVEREMGFEPTATCLEGRSSTAELLPHACNLIDYIRCWLRPSVASMDYTVDSGGASIRIFDSHIKRDVINSLTLGLVIFKLILAPISGPVAQRQSDRLITGWSLVRIQAGPPFSHGRTLIS